MGDKKKLPEMIELFKEEFNGELSVMNSLIEYEVLIMEIEIMVNENPNDEILGSKIRIIMSNWINNKS